MRADIFEAPKADAGVGVNPNHLRSLSMKKGCRRAANVRFYQRDDEQSIAASRPVALPPRRPVPHPTGLAFFVSVPLDAGGWRGGCESPNHDSSPLIGTNKAMPLTCQ